MNCAFGSRGFRSRMQVAVLAFPAIFLVRRSEVGLCCAPCGVGEIASLHDAGSSKRTDAAHVQFVFDPLRRTAGKELGLITSSVPTVRPPGGLSTPGAYWSPLGFRGSFSTQRPTAQQFVIDTIFGSHATVRSWAEPSAPWGKVPRSCGRNELPEISPSGVQEV